MRARIDMSEVETRTKIRARYLRAIENEEWDLLPGPVYIKSFLRTYSEYLGLDSRLLVDEFKRQYELPGEPELRQPSGLRQGKERRERRERERVPRPIRGPLIPPWAIIGVVLIAVVAALWYIGSHSSGNKPNPTGAQTGTHHPRHRTVAVKHHKPKPKMAKVKLVATGPVYICAENRAGKVMLPGATYSPGQAIPLLKGRQVFLTLGNSAVTMTANGKRYSVPSSGNAIGLKVTSKGVSQLAAGHGPTCTAGATG
jgi:hypothetical protein